MQDTFDRSLRTITHEPSSPVFVGAGVGFGLLVAWLGWFALARVNVYEASQSARVEYARAARPVQVAVAGTVVLEALHMGTRVYESQQLLQLDASLEKKRLLELETRLAAIAPQREALVRQIAHENEQLALMRQASEHAIAEARAQDARSTAKERYARERAQSLARTDGALARLAVLEAGSEHEQAIASAAESGAHLARTLRDQAAQHRAALARSAELTRNLAQLDGELASSSAARAVLEQEIEQRKVRAPLTGQLGEVATLRPGSVVKPGDRIATILPSDELHAVAEFPPARVAGKLHAGQRARLRLDSFPFTQYGSIPLRVANVAREVRDGTLRVELTLDEVPTPIPIQHGLTGSVEVELEQLSPALLVLRAAGHMLTRAEAETP